MSVVPSDARIRWNLFMLATAVNWLSRSASATRRFP